MTQRDMMRKLLIQHGYDEQAVCSAYAKAEQAGLIARSRNISGYTPEGYARAVWRDGHRSSGPWILEFCRSHGIKTNA
jgi:hypothetical protein